MALTRKSLAALGIEADKVEEIINAHVETVNGLKDEKEALQMVSHVTGRTDFDREMTAKLAPQATYHFMNETLRDDFYTDHWNIDRIERYSIFLSQGNYPIKGMHFVLDVLPDIVKKYPETMLLWMH